VKKHLDGLMEERGIDVAVLSGAIKGNPSMYYMVNGAALSFGYVIKKRGEEPVLICSSMEREEAAKSGLQTIDMAKYDYMGILKNAGGDRLKARVGLWKAMFKDQGVTGTTAFYGLGGIGSCWRFLNALSEALPNVEVTGELDNDVFLTARMTKGHEEIARIREVGRLTKEVVQHIIDFIRSHRIEGETFMKGDASPLTIGDCKSEIKMSLAKRGLIEEVDTIFAIGRDAGIPHSRGNDPDPIETGKTIVFDIFPQEGGGGYFFDMTRTLLFGQASDEIAKAYKDLEDCHDAVTSELKAGEREAVYQTMVCDFFEKRGYETPRTNPQVTNGYVHSLGHGIGVQIHEKPTLSDAAGNDDTLEVGSVFTVEPGLYFPDKGFGMRIEDVYHVTESGQMENLTNFPRGLVFEV